MSKKDKGDILQIPSSAFPDTTEKGRIKATIANLRYLFEHYGIICQYDEILKKQTVSLAFGQVENDLSESSTYSQIKSLLALNDMPLATLDLLPALMEQSRTNPVFDYVTLVDWDGIDRITALCETLVVNEADTTYRNLAVKTWLIQCVAALDAGRHTPLQQAIPKFELVLVLQGGQGAKKTTWFKSLLPRNLSAYIKDGMHLDPSDKDTIKKCISCWLCELGELDATFRKADIARLKAFLSNERDEIRLPYDRVTSHFRRRTSFCASVNPTDFLTDSTGARRFLPLQVIDCKELAIEKQQLWAQCWHHYFVDGEQWWCSPELEQLLIKQHEKHSETSVIEELLAVKFNTDMPEKHPQSTLLFEHLTATQIVMRCGVAVPTKDQLKQAKHFLEKKGFKQLQNKGARGYWISERPLNTPPQPIDNTATKITGLGAVVRLDGYRHEPIEQSKGGLLLYRSYAIATGEYVGSFLSKKGASDTAVHAAFKKAIATN